jgi:hypothetical protein
MGVNSCVLVILFARHFELRGKRVPAVNYCLGLLAVGVVFSVLSTVSLMLPEGPGLEAVVALTLCWGVFTNTFFVLITVNLIGHGRGGYSGTRSWLCWCLFARSGVCHKQLAPCRGGRGHKTQADGFFYDIGYTPLNVAVSVYSVILTFFAIAHVFNYGKTGMMRKTWIRWLLLVSTLLPALFTLLEWAVPLFAKLHLSITCVWIPIALICYLFFGYLFSARKRALDNINDVYVVFDLNGCCVDINKKGKEFFMKYSGTEYPLPVDLSRLIGVESIMGIISMIYIWTTAAGINITMCFPSS